MKKHEIAIENATPSKLDAMKWVLASLLVVLSVGTGYYYTALPWAVRIVGVVAAFILAAFIASRTYHGHELIAFMKGARSEVRKVVWPTRPETTQATLIVVVVVCISSLVLWLIDAILFHLITWLTG